MLITSWIIAFFVTLSGVSGTVGATTLSVEQMPWHVHYGVERSGGNNWHHTNEGAAYFTSYSQTDAAGGNQPHTHSMTGTVSAANNLPPYYALAWIMRCA